MSVQYALLLVVTHTTFLAMIVFLKFIRKVKKAVVYFLLAEYFAAFTPFTIIAVLFEHTATAVLIIFVLHNLVLAVVSFFLRNGDGRH